MLTCSPLSTRTSRFREDGPMAPKSSYKSALKDCCGSTVTVADSLKLREGSVLEVTKHVTMSVEPVSGMPLATGGTNRSILIARYSRIPIGSISSVDELVSLSMICQRCSEVQLMEYWAGALPMLATEIRNPAESPGAAVNPSVPSGVMSTSSSCSMTNVNR